jgi:hypothetical protein
MIRKERHIIGNTRISAFTFRPESILGKRVMRVIHKYSCGYRNTSSTELLFWRGVVLKGWIDLPKTLEKAFSTIRPDDVYSFKELLINGKPVDFKKNIRFCGPSKVCYQITCRKMARPRVTYHVSYIEEGLYEFNDFYEDQIRTDLQPEVIVVEKPENVRVTINSFGENATLHVLKESSNVLSAEIRGKLVSGNGFSLHWQEARKSQDSRGDTSGSRCSNRPIQRKPAIKEKTKHVNQSNPKKLVIREKTKHLGITTTQKETEITPAPSRLETESESHVGGRVEPSRLNFQTSIDQRDKKKLDFRGQNKKHA